MKLFGKNLDEQVVVIAEIGVNHEGDAAKAEELVRLAAEVGADAVKFQTYTPERYASASNVERLAQVKRFCLPYDVYRNLAAIAHKSGIGFFSTPLTEDVVEFVAGIGDAVKIASGDVVFEPTVRAAMKTNHPVIISTGNATVDEIDRTVGWCREEAGDELAERVAVLHCIAAYPTPVEQANVLSVPFLRDRYGLTVGYSNHVIGSEPVLAAVALGARIVEVHFTDRREGRTFRDHQLSFDPEGMRRLVECVRLVYSSLGVYGKARAQAEAPSLAAMRKGVVAARNLVAGTRIAASDVTYARPATEIAASDIGKVVGRTLKVGRASGEQISFDDLS